MAGGGHEGEAQRLEARVRGRVQGVFYRANTQREAQRLHLTGTVCNRGDGTVDVIAEGAQPALEELLSWLRRGPAGARVDRVDAGWRRASGQFDGFRIVREGDRREQL